MSISTPSGVEAQEKKIIKSATKAEHRGQNGSFAINTRTMIKLLESQAARCRPWSLPDLTAVRSGEQGTSIHTSSVDLAPFLVQGLFDVASKAGLVSSAVVIQAAYGCLVADYLEQGAVLIETVLPSLPERDGRVTVPTVVDGGRRLKGQDRDEEADDKAEQRTTSDLLQDLNRQWKGYEEEIDPSEDQIRSALGWSEDQAVYPALFVVEETKPDSKQGTSSNGKQPLDGRGLALQVILDASRRPCKIVLSASPNFLSTAHTSIFVRQIEAQISAIINAFATPTKLCRLTWSSSSSADKQLLSIQEPIYVDEHTAVAPHRHPCFWLRKYAHEHPDWIAAEELIDALPEEEDEGSGTKASMRVWTYAELGEKSDRIAQLLIGQNDEQKEHGEGRRGPAVGVCMHRTLEAFAVVLAIFKAGCVYLPIAEDLPEERKRTLVEDSGAKTVFVSDDDALASSLKGQQQQLRVIRLSAATELPQCQTIPLPCSGEDAHSTGYLLYTSGSTGKPKGVAVSGANLSSYVEGYAAILARHSPRSMSLSGKGRYLNLASRAFDPHLSQMFMSWRMGYAATTGPRAALLEDLPRTVRLLNITHMGLLPSLVEHAGMTPDTVPSLAVLGVGGEKVTPFVLDEWAKPRKDGPLVVNLYGPTETTIGCTLAVVTPKMSSRNIGYPIGASYSIILLPGTETVARRGQAGELCLAADLVAHGGYHGRAASDQGGFVAVSLPQVDESSSVRLYRTGDMVQMLDDGSLSFLGRADEQIKIRGQRLELAEVNAVVRAAADEVESFKLQGMSQEAVTIYTKHPSLPQPRLFTVLGWSAKGVQTQTVNFIREHTAQVDAASKQITKKCAQTMPSFMVPTLVIVKDGLPKLPSGKTDVKKVTKALQEVGVDVLLGENLKRKSKSVNGSSSSKGEARMTLNRSEKQVLVTILSLTTKAGTTLNESPATVSNQIADWIRPSTSIFELGIDSLSAVGLVARLRRPPHLLDATVPQILQRDSLEELAQLPKQRSEAEMKGDIRLYDAKAFDQQVRDGANEAMCKSVEWYRPATPLQEALVALTTLARQRRKNEAGSAPTTLPYVQHLTIDSPNGTTKQDVIRAWQAAVKAEPMLRTCFYEDEGGGNTVQAVLAASESVIDAVVQMLPKDLTGRDKVETTLDIMDNIFRLPPVRIHIQDPSSSSAGRVRTYISIHHSLYDGWTLPRLLRDTFNDAKTSQQRAIVPANNAHDTLMLEGVARCQSQEALQFWKEYLQDYRYASRSLRRSTKLQSSQADGEAQEEQDRVGKVKMYWTGERLAKLKQVAQKKHRTTIAVVVQACLAVVVAKRLGVSDVILGNVFSGRGSVAGEKEEQLEDASTASRMPYLTTVAVRNQLGAASLDGAVAEAKTRIAQATTWAHTSLRTIQALVGGNNSSSTSRRSLFDVLFSYDAVPAQDETVPSPYKVVENSDEEGQGNNVDYPLVLNVRQEGQKSLELTVAYSLRDVGEETGEAIAAQLEILLSLISRGQDVPLAELGIVSTSGADDVLKDADEDEESQEKPSRPLTDEESIARDTLVRIVKDVKAEEIGPYTSFYRVGLDSITAIRFARELKKHAHFSAAAIDATKVLESGTLAVLCGEKVDNQDKQTAETKEAATSTTVQQQESPLMTNGTVEEASLQEVEEDDTVMRGLFRPLCPGDNFEAGYTCTPLQSGMLTLSHGSAESAYWQAHKLCLRDGVDLGLLRAAWEQVVARNDVLRTTFHLVEGDDDEGGESQQAPRWVAVVHKKVPLAWQHFDGESPAARRGVENANFDEKPLASVDILTSTSKSDGSARTTTAVFHIHHVLYDGVALPEIFRQLRMAYHGLLSASTPTTTTPFYAVARKQASKRSHEEEYWAKTLDGYRYAPLRPRSHKANGDEVEKESRWHASSHVVASTQSLSSACRSLGVTLHAVCVLAYARVLAASALERRDVCFGHVLAGRSSPGQEKIVGPLFNTVARRVCLDSLLDSNAETVVRVQKTLDEGMARQSASLGKVTSLWRRSSTSPQRTAARLFDCLFVFHKEGRAEQEQEETDKEKAPPLWDSSFASQENGREEHYAEQGDDEYEINVSFVERRDGRSLDIFANASQRAMASVEDLQSLIVDELRHVVLDILERPQTPIAVLPKNFSELPLSSQGLEDSNGIVAKDRPMTKDEEAFCDALQDVIKNIVQHRKDWRKSSTNVVDVGIDSITAIRLVSRCKKRGKVLSRISVQLVLRAQTVEAIVKEADAAARGSAPKKVLNGTQASSNGRMSVDEVENSARRTAAAKQLGNGLNEADIEEVFPVLAGQRFYLDAWYSTRRRFYEAPWVLKVGSSCSKIDAGRLKEAWIRLKEINAMLRSTFLTLPQQPQQILQVVLGKKSARSSANSGWSIVQIDSDEDLETATRQIVAHDNVHPCDFFTVPARLTLVQGPRQSAVIIRLHHAIYDAWTIGHLFSHLAKLYSDNSAEKNSPTLTSSSLTTLSRNLLAQPSIAERQQWWRAHLASSQTTLLDGETSDKTAKGPQLFVRMPCAVSELSQLESKAQAKGVHLRFIVVFGLARILSRYTTAKRCPTFGFFTAGRAGVEVEAENVDMDAVPLINVLPFSVQVGSSFGGGESSIKARLDTIRDSMTKRIAWEQTSLRDVVTWCNKGQPTFDCFLNLLWHGRDESGEEDGKGSSKPDIADEDCISFSHWKGLAESGQYFTSPIVHPLTDDEGRATTALGAALDVSYLPEHKCYIDVRRDERNDCIALGVTADAGMWKSKEERGNLLSSEERLRKFCQEFADEVRSIIDEL